LSSLFVGFSWITLEQGKTTADAMGDVWRGLEVVEAATRVGSEMLGDSLQNLASGLDTVSYRVPLGVCAGIGKFHLLLLNRKIFVFH